MFLSINSKLESDEEEEEQRRRANTHALRWPPNFSASISACISEPG